ncbi:MAG: hypothetical protein H0V89_00930 [Deltaproteobacteria bacterium]|nr:hypothetical protein [Deltaproteobacteria bacterium]
MVGGRQGAFLQYMNVDIQFSTFVGAAEGLELDACRDTSEVQNSVFSGGNCDLRGDGTAYEVEWNGFDNGAGCGILGAFSTLGDPLFVASPADLHLQVGSPMIDAADPAYEDPDGSDADLGRWGGPEALGAP